MKLVDSHCHLDFPDFEADRDGVLDRARAAGVARLITICTRVSRFGALVALTERYPEVFCTVGTHPHQAEEEPDVSLADLVRLSAHPKCVGIGEAGLDYHYDKAPRAVAATVFRTHIAAAREIGLPLVIHARGCGRGTSPTSFATSTRAGRFPRFCIASRRPACLPKSGSSWG